LSVLALHLTLKQYMSNVEMNLNKSYNAQQHPFHLVKPSP